MRSFSVLSSLLAVLPSSLAIPTYQGLEVRQDSNGTSSTNSNSTGIDASYDVTKCPGYALGEIKQASSGFGFTAPLSLNGEACNAYGVDIQNLTLAVVREKPHQLHVHIYDTARNQYQLPLDEIFTRPDSDPETIQGGASEEESDLVFNHSDQAPFEFWISRKDGGEVIFDTRKANIPTYDDPLEGSVASKRNTTAMPAHEMIFENQYLQLSSALPKDASIYGLGEYYSGSFRRDSSNTVQPFFTLDAGDPIDSNMYGYHPIYTEARLSSDNSTLKSHSVYFQNTAGLDVILRDGLVQYRAIGGTLDFRFFSGDESSANSTNSTSSSSNSTEVVSRDLLERQDVENNNSTSTNTTSSTSTNSINTAIAQYVQFIGLPLLAPEWSFGFHLCRWGYTNISETQAVVDAMREHSIPLEVQWNDIDYLHEFRDFTTDPSRFPIDQFKNFTAGLAANHQHYIPIIDAAIPAAPVNASDVYNPGTVGLEQDVFLKNSNGTTYIGQVWPGYTFFVDNSGNNTQEWFNQVYRNFTSMFNDDLKIPDGIWLDMSEPSSFCVGSCGSNANLSNTPTYVGATSVAGWPLGYDNNTFGNSGNMTVNGTSTFMQGYKSNWSRRDVAQGEEALAHLEKRDDGDEVTFAYQNDTQRYLVNPPYAIHNGQHSSEGPLIDNLAKKTVSPEAISQGGVFYDLHNLDGTLVAMHTHNALLDVRPDERPFIVARSSYPGFGQYAHHWLGDNYSKWLYLQKNIQGLLQFQLFGVPMIGSDTCGFNGNTDEELCNRWMMAGAWSPFYRNHNTQGAISQEPFRWESVANASRVAINKRLEMLPTLYSILARSTQTGAPSIRALWYEFPQHFDQLKGSDSQYLFGPNILVTPVMEPNVTTVKGFFPSQGAPWRNVYDHTTLNTTYDTNSTISAPLSTINVHARAGSALLTYQDVKYTTKETRDGQYSMFISLTDDETASGDTYVDDGVSLKPTSRELTIKVNNGTLSASSTGDYTINQTLGSVTILGLKNKPASVQVLGQSASNFTYEEALQRFNVTGLSGDLNKDLDITWT